MADVRPYTEQVGAQGQLNVQSSPAEFGSGIGNAIQGLGQKIYENEVNQEVTNAHQIFSQKQLEWTQQITEQSNAATPGDNTFAPNFIESVKKDMNSLGSQFNTPRGKAVFNDLSNRLTTSFGLKAIAVQSELAGRAERIGFTSAIDAESKVVNSNENEYAESKSRTDALIDSYKNIDAVTKQQLKTAAREKLALSVVEGYFGRDIIGAAKRLLPDAVTQAYSASSIGEKQGSKFDDVMSFIFKEEGGYKAKDGNSNAPVNYGINQKANPTVDVKNLTKEGAKQIYLTEYWGKINGDKLPPNMAVVAMNAAVNQGPDVAKAMIQQSGGDPSRFTELVKQRYQAIVDRDPAQGKYLKGWMARADRALAESLSGFDTNGNTAPQLKIAKDTALSPPQNSDIPGWSDMKLDDQQRMMSKLITDFNSKVHSDRVILSDDRKDMTANFLAGNNYSKEKELQSRYVAAYGPDMAKKMIEEDRVNKDLGQFTNLVRGRSMNEITASLGQPPGDNSTSEQYVAYSKKIAIIQQDRQELEKNPVDYVSRYSTPVKQAAILADQARQDFEKTGSPDALSASASATQRFITASLSEQSRLGVANPRVLSEDQEKSLISKIEQIAGTGQDVAQNIDTLYKSYGKYGPTVAAQMSKKVGGLVNILGSGVEPTAAAMLVEANRNKEELKKTINPEVVKELDNSVRSAMSEYSQSLVAIPNGASVQSNYQEQIGNLAMLRMSKLGESPKDAVKKAYKALVGDLYTFQDGYRVPSQLDAKIIKSQANSILSNLSETDVALLPGSLGNPTDRMKAQLSSIRAYGKWVTTSQIDADGRMVEGLSLVVPTASGGYSSVPGVDGKPIFKSFGQMIIDHTTKQTSTSQDALMKGDMLMYSRLKASERAQQKKLEQQREKDINRSYREGR